MEEPQSPFSHMRASGGVVCRLFLQEKSLISTYMCTYTSSSSNFAKYGHQNGSKFSKPSNLKKHICPSSRNNAIWIIPWKIIIFVSAPPFFLPWDLLERWTAISALGDGEDLPSPHPVGGRGSCRESWRKNLCMLYTRIYQFTNIVDMYTVNIDIYIYYVYTCMIMNDYVWLCMVVYDNW